jgi:hypothetical protein
MEKNSNSDLNSDLDLGLVLAQAQAGAEVKVKASAIDAHIVRDVQTQTQTNPSSGAIYGYLGENKFGAAPGERKTMCGSICCFWCDLCCTKME